MPRDETAPDRHFRRGKGKPPDQCAEARIDVVIATPGRLLDLHGRNFVDLSGVEYFVLDEADRMLDMGFVRDVRKIVAALPKDRQSLLFSATMPNEIAKLSKCCAIHCELKSPRRRHRSNALNKPCGTYPPAAARPRRCAMCSPIPNCHG